MPRPGNAANGYGGAHKRLRRYYATRVAAGLEVCARCREPIAPGARFHLDHDDEDRSRYLGVSHVRCNERAAGLLAHARRVVEVFSREW